jgi:hypothetical protein
MEHRFKEGASHITPDLFQRVFPVVLARDYDTFH